MKPSDAPPRNVVSERYSDDMLRAIGTLFLSCSSTEMALRFQLARLHHHPHPATINTLTLLGGMENKVMLERISVGTLMLAPNAQREVQGLCDKIRKIFERRNEIAHNSAILGERDRLELALGKIASSGKITMSKVYTTRQIYQFASDLLTRARCLDQALTGAGVRPLPKSIELELAQQAGSPPHSHLPIPQ